MLFYFIFLAFVVYLFSIMPNIFKKRNLNQFENIFYSHRGLHNSQLDLSPENSLEAFKLSVENGFGIELDVQLSKDNIPVVIHDFNLSRLCGVDLDVRNLTLEDIKKYNLLNSKENIPTLQEVLDLVHGKVPLIVEIKATNNIDKTCLSVAKVLDNYMGVYCIESFNPFAALWYKKNRPDIIRGQLSTNHIKSKKHNFILAFLLQFLCFNFLTKPDFICYNVNYKNNISFILCKKLYKVFSIAYTIPSKEMYIKSKNYYDLFIFENFNIKEI